MIEYSYQKGSLPPTTRIGVRTLLFKKGEKTDLKNYRPLSLLCTDYKIIAKALANRTKSILSTLIHDD
jgi:hypothetical protein